MKLHDYEYRTKDVEDEWGNGRSAHRECATCEVAAKLNADKLCRECQHLFDIEANDRRSAGDTQWAMDRLTNLARRAGYNTRQGQAMLRVLHDFLGVVTYRLDPWHQIKKLAAFRAAETGKPESSE